MGKAALYELIVADLWITVLAECAQEVGQHLFIEVDLLGSVIVSNDGGQQLALALAIKFGDAKHAIEDIGLIFGFTKL